MKPNIVPRSSVISILFVLTNLALLSNSAQLFSSSSNDSTSSLDGKHLRLLLITLPGVYDVKTNSSGHVISTAGAITHMLEWLAQSYNFTYSFIPLWANGTESIDDLPDGKRGALSYVRSGEGDMIVTAAIATPTRFAYSDFTMPWMESPYSILIPVPAHTINIGAIIQPMKKEIWICIILTVPIVAASFYGLNKCLIAIDERKRKCFKTTNNAKLPLSYNNSLNIFDYVFRILMSQGGYCRNKTFSIRFLAGIWCLCCFVLIQAYSSTLISFITLPNEKPIISSIYDIPKVPGLKITVTRNRAADIRFLENTMSSGIFHILKNVLLQHPELRCNVTEDCLDKVRSGNHVYIHGNPIIRNIIANDKKKTGQCHFTVAEETLMMGYLYFMLAKHSPYTEEISHGILRLKANGLLDKWIRDYSNNDSSKCNLKNILHRNAKSQLTLQDMASAFFILIIGHVAAIITFAFPTKLFL